jgi:hypothetical protein
VVQDFSDLYARGDEDGEPHLPTACWP